MGFWRSGQFWFWSFSAVSVVVVAVWLSSADETRRRAVEFEQVQPDYFMESFTSLALGQNGLPRYQLKAQSMYHLLDNNFTEFDAPRLIIVSEQGEWRLASETGEMVGGDELLMQGSVRIERLEPEVQKLEIETSDVSFGLHNNIAETSGEVTIRRGENVVDASGMRVYLNEQRVELLSNVRGRYFVE